jgi:hypothetical protein
MASSSQLPAKPLVILSGMAVARSTAAMESTDPDLCITPRMHQGILSSMWKREFLATSLVLENL